MRVRIVLITALAAGLSTVTAASAAVESATVQVDGLACPFCAFGLEKQLKKLEAVEAVTIDVEAGVATLRLAAGSRLTRPEDPDEGLAASIPKAVEAGGFTARELRLVVAGRLETRGDSTLLVAAGTRERIAVDVGAIEALPDGPVRVEGIVRPGTQPPTLVIRGLLENETPVPEKEGT